MKPKTSLINISELLVTSYGTRAKIVSIIPLHPYPLVVATNKNEMYRLFCFDVFGNPALNHTCTLYNANDPTAPDLIKEESEDDAEFFRSKRELES